MVSHQEGTLGSSDMLPKYILQLLLFIFLFLTKKPLHNKIKYCLQICIQNVILELYKTCLCLYLYHSGSCYNLTKFVQLLETLIVQYALIKTTDVNRTFVLDNIAVLNNWGCYGILWHIWLLLNKLLKCTVATYNLSS